MRNVLSSKVLFGVLALAAAGCSGGSGSTTGNVSIRCAGGEAFCLISCDLGCSQTGCAVTEIAENQRLRFVFSDRIDPTSVNGASVSIRTPSGVAPAGDLLVSGRELTFAPRVSSVGGVSTFGFARNESYVVTLSRAANGQGIRSTDGAGLEREFSCTVFASRGIQDEDQLPPTVTLVAPATLTNVATNPTIVLRFSELIDTTPLQGGLSASSPITFVLRGTVTSGGATVCDNDAAGTALEGIPVLSTERVGATDVTVVQFAPPLTLPGSACLTVTVTGDLRDLSGRPGVPSTFRLVTAAVPPQPVNVTELFATSAQQDLDQSSGAWLNGARPGTIGEDGRHGSFTPTLGTLVGVNDYEIDTDATTIPANRTLNGLQTTVTDGKFYFSDFVLPANTTIRFKGSFPPQIFVRGKVEILGTINISGKDLPFWTPTSGVSQGQRVQDFNARGPVPLGSGLIPGQDGSAGGIGGGRGGKGGNECNGLGAAQPGGLAAFNGQPGQNVQIKTTHAFWGQDVNTGGRGSQVAPITGLAPSYLPTLLLGNQFRAQFAPGGGGGGFATPGAVATFTMLTASLPIASPVQPAGILFDLTQVPAAGYAAIDSRDHFMVGGSGGGGGASHAFGTQQSTGFDHYVAGSGGSGGGGTMVIRAGGDVSISPSGRLESRGGRGVLINGDDRTSGTFDANWGVSSPGGGGSGGSFLLQAGGNLIANGAIDTTGGEGSRTGNVVIGATPAVFSITSQAGAGAAGFYRLEAGGTVTFNGTGVPSFNAPANAATLDDTDPITASLSKWRFTGQVFPPTWLRYELEVDVDGDGVAETTYTDSGAPGTQKANNPADPVMILFQGAKLNQSGTAPAAGETPKPWRDAVGPGTGPGIGLDSPNGFRFLLRFNRTAGPNCVVRALRVFAQS